MTPLRLTRVFLLLALPLLLAARATAGTAVSPAAPIYTSRIMHITHDGLASTTQVKDTYQNPSQGSWDLLLPREVAFVRALADGADLDVAAALEAEIPQTRVQLVVPAGTVLLEITYHRLDGAYAHDNSFYYQGASLLWDLVSERFSGPMKVVMHLPAGASIRKVSDIDLYGTIVNARTVRFAPPSGKSVHPWVLYDMPSMPSTYTLTQTPRFDVYVPLPYQSPPYHDYRAFLLSFLENTYTLYGGYTAQDVNDLVGQSRYTYTFTPWPLLCGAGCSLAGGPSSTEARYVPMAMMPAGRSYNSLVSVTLHELGNGWWRLLYPTNYPPSTLPWWLDNEAHSGFLRTQAMLDLGYCAEANQQHSGHYQEYLACKNKVPYAPPCDGIVETMQDSLQDKYGWTPFRAIYAGVQDGTLNLDGLSDAEQDSYMIRFLSEQVGENLAPFYAAHGIYASQAVQDELAALPTADVPILSTLTCRANQLRATPDALDFGSTGGTKTLYIAAPQDWTYRVSPQVDWLSVQRDGPYPFATLAVTADADKVLPGSHTAEILIETSPALANSPLRIPVSLTKEPLSGDLYLSLDAAGRVGGVDYAPGDILHFADQQQWQLFFDASRHGITADLHAFTFQDDGALLLVFDSTFELSGAGTVTPWDIVRFRPRQPGDYSQGDFALIFDGSEVGLDAAGEEIDALHAQNLELYLSTTGSFHVEQFSLVWDGADEDILSCYLPLEPGDPITWSNAWHLAADLPSLAGEDIKALSGDLGWAEKAPFIALEDAFSVAGAQGDKQDILSISCNYQDEDCQTVVPWRGAAAGLSDGIDGLHILPDGGLADLDICVEPLPPAETSFSFTGDLGPFSVDEPGVDCRRFTQITYGTYQLSQQASADWYLNDIVCTRQNGNVHFTGEGSDLTVDVPAGADVTCTFHNSLDPYEPNESMETAATIAYGQTLQAAIQLYRHDEVDYYRFSGKAGHHVEVDIVSDQENGDLEPLVTLLDVAGQAVEGSVSGDYFTVRAAYDLPQDGDYYLVVEPGGWEKCECKGTYTLALSRKNSAPVSIADTYTLLAGNPLTVNAPGLLGNDQDADKDDLTAVLTAGALHGSVNLNKDGSFIYMAETGYIGPDRFWYRAEDGLAQSMPVAVDLTVIRQQLYLPLARAQ